MSNPLSERVFHVGPRSIRALATAGRVQVDQKRGLGKRRGETQKREFKVRRSRRLAPPTWPATNSRRLQPKRHFPAGSRSHPSSLPIRRTPFPDPSCLTTATAEALSTTLTTRAPASMTMPSCVSLLLSLLFSSPTFSRTTATTCSQIKMVWVRERERIMSSLKKSSKSWATRA